MATVCNPDYVNSEWSYYRFKPSTAAAILFCTAYTLTTGLHVAQMTRARTWYMAAFVVGGLCECVGYAARLRNTLEDPGCWSLVPYIIQSVLLLVAPALLAASIYMVLGRIVELTDGESHVLIKRRWLTKVFVSSDVLSLVLQSIGGGMMASASQSNNMMTLGQNVIIFGLVVQLVVFGFFVVTAALFHRSMRLAPTAKAGERRIRWSRYLGTLYVTGVLIWVRSVFRVVEYVEGNKGRIMTNEAYMYVFDATLMLLVMAWMNWFHPSEIGLLLRGERPVKNGLGLLMPGRRVGKLQNESSEMSA
ncbi:RTA1-domain-containing protein [Colletotrichum falcatum]|nr:RTA1-domain-containing protein [Colletotrichum falcatum]